jgi:ABC-type multidrug transport system fused ATPase/permease subunit
VQRAARLAHAHEFVRELPKGYDTLVGERGVKLSGGERQRVAIARAILADKPILILDEATSSLDSVSEKLIQEALEFLTQNRTSIIIAHRLSTVRSCDRIAVMEKGKLIACAPHEELVRSCETYKEMVELQSHGMLGE